MDQCSADPGTAHQPDEALHRSFMSRATVSGPTILIGSSSSSLHSPAIVNGTFRKFAMATKDQYPSLNRLVAVLLAASGPALAQSTSSPAPKSDWQSSLGAAAIAAPKSIGSNKTRYLAIPTFEIKYKDFFFIDPIKGVGVQSKPLKGLTISASLGINLDSRRAKDDPRYRGLGDIREALAQNLSLEYEIGDAFISTSASIRLGSRDRRGSTFDVDLGYKLPAAESFFASAGLTARAMDSTYARNFLGVNAQQAAASGLPPFNAESGVQRAGAFVQSAYRISDDWTAFGRLESTLLRGDVARSPIVERKGQASILLSVLKAF
jgi:MipA family protein